MSDLRDVVRVRKGIPKGLRFAVLHRDNFRCVYCGANGQDEKLVIDHIQSFADGGPDDPSNFATACVPCNAGKGRLSVDWTPPPLKNAPVQRRRHGNVIGPIFNPTQHILSILSGGKRYQPGFTNTTKRLIATFGVERTIYAANQCVKTHGPGEPARRAIARLIWSDY